MVGTPDLRSRLQQVYARKSMTNAGFDAAIDPRRQAREEDN
jgi:hypothetical protein